MKIKVEPKINLVVKIPFTFNNKFYDVGHKFHVIGSDSMRGWDIEDDEGNRIYETGMMSHKLERVHDNN